MRSRDVVYVLPVSEGAIFASASATDYDFFGRKVRLLPVPDRLKQRWASARARSIESVIYLEKSIDAGEAIYSHPVETALAQANDPSKDLLWKVIEIPRLVRIRAGVIDASKRPARVMFNPIVTVKQLQLWSPGHSFRTGLFATKQGNLGVSELGHRIVFQFELFSALGSRPVDRIVAGIDGEARRQGNEDIMAQALAVRLLLVKDLASGDFYAPDLMLELNRAVRLTQEREWSSRQPWFLTMLHAMRAADADLRSGGAASLGGPSDPAAPPKGEVSPFSATIADLEPAWLKANAVANEKHAQRVMQLLARNQPRDSSALFGELDALLRARIEAEFGDQRFARSLWQLPPDQFEGAVKTWLSGSEPKKLYRTLVLRNLGEEHVGLMFSGLLASVQNGPEQFSEMYTALADIKAKQEFLQTLLPAGIRALYPKEANSAAIMERYQGFLDLPYCRERLSQQECDSRAAATMLELVRFSVGKEESTFENYVRMGSDEDFDPDLLMQSIIRDLKSPAPRHSLAAMDRLFAIYQLRVIHDEAPDMVSATLFAEGCKSAAELGARMMNEDELLPEASTHRALLALEGVCGGIDFRTHKLFLNGVMSLEGLYP